MVQITPRVANLVVKKRNGQQVPFFEVRIYRAIESAFKEQLRLPQEVDLGEDAKKGVELVTERVVKWCEENAANNKTVFIEDIQDAVIRELKEAGFEDISKRYADYRHAHEIKRFDAERLTVRKRDGRVVSFRPEKIAIAIGKAFAARHVGNDLPSETRQVVIDLADHVVTDLKGRPGAYTIYIEEIQDLVEKILMDFGYYDIVKGYIVYRQERRRQREDRRGQASADRTEKIEKPQFKVQHTDGLLERMDSEKLRQWILDVCHGLEDRVSVEEILQATLRNSFDGIPTAKIIDAVTLAVRPMIEKEPAYGHVAARILLKRNYKEVLRRPVSIEQMRYEYPHLLKPFCEFAVKEERLSARMLEYDFVRLGAALKPERDLTFNYMGIQTLFDRYFIHDRGRRLETPQLFWMRVAMGLALNEGEQKNEQAIEFYNVLSTFRFVSSTPTLFNAGTLRSQLSSCFLTTIHDDLDHIFKCIKDNAMLSKWSGGLGNDWTPVRGMGSLIKGTNGKSQGVIPFMKVANDTAVAVNQGGKRKGAVCGYLEVWHVDIEEFLDLRKNTGDDRRRTPDMHTANWIPDLFMKRVLQDKDWTLFTPNEVPELHDLYGKAFEAKYTEYENLAKAGKIKYFKSISAIQLWRRMLSMLFETGHPWVTFKDPSNLRSPQDHIGVVHSSNLCTEILLNTSGNETAVCNLGSINLPVHMTASGLDRDLLADTIKTAMRMLDNVIDINYYPTQEAENSNRKHRPVGLGIMGFQDALYIQGISYSSARAAEFADESMEFISYHAILSSSLLAKERGAYSSYKGSKWDRGLLPIDTLDLLESERGGHLEVDRTVRMDWQSVRESIKKYGMRNSNTMAIAPTATIANITDVTQSIEPTYKHLFVKSNLSGEFTVANPYLVAELKAMNLWDEQMVNDLKYFDGNLQEIERIPQSIKDRYPTSFDIDYEWIIECASRRQKWIDMGQSLNLYMQEPSGKKLHNMYMTAWLKGLKTTYYLRSLGATRIEKSTVDVNKYGDPLGKKSVSAMKSNPAAVAAQAPPASGTACKLNTTGGADEDCEACQ